MKRKLTELLTLPQETEWTEFKHNNSDPQMIRETLHNCIAHEDYSKGGKINVVETPSSLLFTNVGMFLPGTVEEVIVWDAPPEVYPNRFLAEAMVNLNMIDTIGSGIKRMFTRQRQRNFPMPDYDLSEQERVKVRVIGEVIDTNLLQEMRREKVIQPVEGKRGKGAKWELCNRPGQSTD